jgi:hypothetical protein
MVPNHVPRNVKGSPTGVRPLIRGGAVIEGDATIGSSQRTDNSPRRMDALLIATLSGAGAACAGTCLVGAWWHRRRTRLLTTRIARLHAELDRLRAPRHMLRAESPWRTESPSIRLSTSILQASPQRRRFWPAMRSRLRALDDRRAAVTVALPFLDTVASTRHTAGSHEPN